MHEQYISLYGSRNFYTLAMMTASVVCGWVVRSVVDVARRCFAETRRANPVIQDVWTYVSSVVILPACRRSSPLVRPPISCADISC